MISNKEHRYVTRQHNSCISIHIVMKIPSGSNINVSSIERV